MTKKTTTTTTTGAGGMFTGRPTTSTVNIKMYDCTQGAGADPFNDGKELNDTTKLDTIAIEIADVVSSKIAFNNMGYLLGRLMVAVPVLYTDKRNTTRKKLNSKMLKIAKELIEMRSVMIPRAEQFVKKHKSGIGKTIAKTITVLEETERKPN